MNSKKLISVLGYVGCIPSIEIDAIVQHPSKATPSSMFVCLCGMRADGHDFAIEAYQNGCRMFVAQKPLDLPQDAFVCTVSDTRCAHARLANEFFGHPSRSMRVIGITGTKGKTMTALLVRQLLENNGIPCGYIGTNGVQFENTVMTLNNTTPDPVTLQGTLRMMLDMGVQAVALEVSSQAIYQHRVDGICFDTCVYTNLYSDHVGVGEHPSFAHYKECKHRLFTDFVCNTVVYNADDAYADEMIDGCLAKRRISYSIKDQSCDLFAKDIKKDVNKNGFGSRFSICHSHATLPACLPMPGEFNVSNALAALAVATSCFGILTECAIQALQSVTVEGRAETVRLPNGAYALIDYAHNGASLEHLLSSMRSYTSGRLICLFGSVGERSQLRRRELGDAAAKHCDLVILTSDNPGREDPEAIMNEIAVSFKDSSIPYLKIADRREAILEAVRLTRPDDLLILAGKGHEQYQLIGTQKLPFSDKAVLMHALQCEKIT